MVEEMTNFPRFDLQGCRIGFLPPINFSFMPGPRS